MYNNTCVAKRTINIGSGVIQIMEKYSRGWRGAPAKGVGRSRGARVQIPLSPFSYQFVLEVSFDTSKFFKIIYNSALTVFK